MKLGVNDVNRPHVSLRPPTDDASLGTKEGETTRATSLLPTEQKKLAGQKPAEIHNDKLAMIAVVVAGAAWWAFR